MAAESFPIEAGHVLMFARSIGDPNPVYVDEDSEAARAVGGRLAPPTFVQASAQFDPDYPLRPQPGRPWFGSGRTPSGLRPASGDPAEAGSADESTISGDRGEKSSGGGGTGLHAEQHYEFHRTPRVGDVLTATTRSGEQWEKQGRRAGNLVFSELVTEFWDQDGELVVTARSVGVRTESPVGG